MLSLRKSSIHFVFFVWPAEQVKTQRIVQNGSTTGRADCARCDGSSKATVAYTDEVAYL